jgi:hypothetical protein
VGEQEQRLLQGVSSLPQGPFRMTEKEKDALCWSIEETGLLFGISNPEPLCCGFPIRREPRASLQKRGLGNPQPIASGLEIRKSKV